MSGKDPFRGAPTTDEIAVAVLFAVIVWVVLSILILAPCGQTGAHCSL